MIFGEWYRFLRDWIIFNWELMVFIPRLIGGMENLYKFKRGHKCCLQFKSLKLIFKFYGF